MKKKIGLLFTAFMLFFCNVFAYAGTDAKFASKDICVSEEDYITISSQGDTWKVDYRCLPNLSLTISESKRGLLKEGKTIYFSTDTAFQLENYLNIECENGSIVLSPETITKEDKNVYAVHIKEVNYSKNLPLTAVCTTNPYISVKQLSDEETIAFPLRIITGPEFEDNLFSGKDDKTIILNENFLTVDNSMPEYITNRLTDTTRHMEIKIGQYYLTCDGKQIPLSAPAYIDTNDTVMLPLRETAENLGASIHVGYDSQNRTVLIQTYVKTAYLPLGGSHFTQNNVSVPYMVPMAVQNGKSFLSSDDLAYILSIPSDMVKWDSDTQTLTFN